MSEFIEQKIKQMKRGETVNFPIIPSTTTLEASPMVDMERIAAEYKIPLRKLKYTREIYYFEYNHINRGWEDMTQISYTKK